MSRACPLTLFCWGERCGQLPVPSVSESADTQRTTRPGGHLPLATDRKRLARGAAATCAGCTPCTQPAAFTANLKPSNVLVTQRAEWWCWIRPRQADRNSVFRKRRADRNPGLHGAEQAKSGPSQPAAGLSTPVGAMLYEVLTGRLPHQGDMMEILLKKQSEDPPAPIEVIPWLIPS